MVTVWFVLAAIGPLIAPYSAHEFQEHANLEPPSRVFLCGTDQYGRDILSRIIVGSRSVILVASLATAFAVSCGAIVGLVSGYNGGLFDEVVMRLLDGLLSIPTLLSALVLLSVLGAGTRNVILAIGIINVSVIARVARSATLGVVSLEYVEAAKVRGESALYIIFREILPNILGPLMVEGSVRFSDAILTSAALGFLGMGVRPPTPDWGLMVNEGRNFVIAAPWLPIFPGLAIASLVVGVNLLVEGFQEVFVIEPV